MSNKVKEINLEFVGVDFWSRPVYKWQDKEVYIGSVDTLLPDDKVAPNGTTEEINAYFREHLDELVLFGTSFDSEEDPLGSRINKDIKINIV